MKLLRSHVDEAGGVAVPRCSLQVLKFCLGGALVQLSPQSLLVLTKPKFLAGWMVTTREVIWVGLPV